MQLGPDAQARIRDVGDALGASVPGALDAFYAQLRAFPETKAFFNAVATGVLIFLLVETLTGSIDPVEHALEAVTVHGGGTWGEFVGKAAVFLGCFGFGLLSLVYYDRWMSRRGHRAMTSVGPGAASVDEYRAGRAVRQRRAAVPAPAE